MQNIPTVWYVSPRHGVSTNPPWSYKKYSEKKFRKKSGHVVYINNTRENYDDPCMYLTIYYITANTGTSSISTTTTTVCSNPKTAGTGTILGIFLLLFYLLPPPSCIACCSHVHIIMSTSSYTVLIRSVTVLIVFVHHISTSIFLHCNKHGGYRLGKRWQGEMEIL